MQYMGTGANNSYAVAYVHGTLGWEVIAIVP